MESLRYINYNRKSSDDSGYKQVLSIASQRDEAQQQIDRYKLQLIDTINESKSAKVPGLRIGYRKMIQSIRNGKANAILCWKLDRLARNMVEGGEIIELLQLGKIREIRTPHKTYTSQENAILLAVEFGSANQYSRDLSENVKRGLRRKAQMGVPPGIACFGYTNIKNADGTDRKWAVDKPRFIIMQSIFKRLLSGRMSVRAVYYWAMKQYSMTTPVRRNSGGRPVTLSYFYTLITNPIYAGYFYYHNERYSVHKDLPRALSESEFHTIQCMIGSNINVARIRHESTYAGLLRSPEGEYLGPDFKFQVICDCKFKFSYRNRTDCPNCTLPLAQMQNPKYLSYVYYYNVNQRKMGNTVKGVSERIIDDAFISCFADCNVGNDVQPWLLTKVTKHKDATRAELILAEMATNSRVTKLNQRRVRLRGLLADGIISSEEYQNDISKIDAELSTLQPASNTGDNLPGEIELLCNAKDKFINGSSDQKRMMVSRFSSNLTWDGKNLCITYFKWVNQLRIGLLCESVKNELFELKKLVEFPTQMEYFDLMFPSLSSLLDTVRASYFEEILITPSSTPRKRFSTDSNS